MFGTHAGGGFADLIRGERALADVDPDDAHPESLRDRGATPRVPGARFDRRLVVALEQLRSNF